MKILFTTSAEPEKNPFSTSEKRPPLGIGSLISVVRCEGHDVFFIDNYLKPSSFVKDGYLQKNKIDFVAIYANTICYKDTLRMFEEIRNLRKQGLWSGKIVVGGPHTSVALETIPDFVDYVVQGEGERAILEIINGRADQRIIHSERMENLDSVPFQPWDIFTELPYDFSCRWIDAMPIFTMNTSRGCPFDCTFCSVDSVWGRKYTCFNSDRIISEIEHVIRNFDAKGIYFREDNFTLSKDRTVDFCTKLIDKKINIDWACETRVDTMSEKLIELMSKSGCRAFYLGIESGSQRILDKLNKGITVQQIGDAILWCKKYNIKTYCSLLVGTPQETFEDYLLTEKLMKRLKPYEYDFNVFVGIPNSSLYNSILEKNLYEHKDDIGLLYLPGYDVKTKFFYGRDSKSFVDYNFNKRTEFDRQLMKRQLVQSVKRKIFDSINMIRNKIHRK